MSTYDPRQRFPLMPEPASARLRAIEEHPHAPQFTHPGVDRVTAKGLEDLSAFDSAVHDSPPLWRPGEPPAWTGPFVERCYRSVPFYRANGGAPRRLEDTPTCSRADLAAAPWSFVPDDEALDGLIVYNTSGTTGHPLAIPTHPDTLACYVPLLRAGLARAGVTLDGGSARPAAIVQVCWQRTTYTMAGLLAALDWAGFAKINLAPGEWRTPDDRARFLEACDPEILTGDPLAFEELARLPLRLHLKALVSTAMELQPAVRRGLEARFECPVLDFYSLNESGPVGVCGPGDPGFTLLQPRLLVEILDEAGRACPPGVPGEITLTGGFNRLLPLLRDRTGDFAALSYHGGRPTLVGLHGRPPVVFTAAGGRPVNNVDVSNALRPFGLGQHTLHQSADGTITLKLRDARADENELRAALETLFGAGQPIVIETDAALEAPDGKVVQYTRAAA